MNNFSTAILVVIVAAFVAGGVFYAIEFQPVLSEREGKIADIEELEKKLAGLKNIDKEIEKLRVEKSNFEKQKNKLQTDSISMNEIVPMLLNSTEIIANKFGVKFQDIRISPLVRAEDWSELPVEMTVLGTFNNINCFLNVMEARKLINLADGSMSIAVSSEVDKDSKKPVLSVNLSAKAYILGTR